MKKTLAIILAVMMTLSLMPTVFAGKHAVKETLSGALCGEGMTLEFVSEGDYPWIVETDETRVYAKSGNAGIGDSTSEVSVELDAEAGDVLSFDYKTSSEEDWDEMCVYVNNEAVDYFSGEHDWTSEYYVFDSDGTYTITWKYEKDGSYDVGDDVVMLDNVMLKAPSEATDYSMTNNVLIGVGYGMELVVVPVPEYDTLPEVVATSADAEIATVEVTDDTILITGVAIGTTTVSVVVGELEAREINVEVAESRFGKAFVLYDNDNRQTGWYEIDVVTGDMELIVASEDSIYAAEYYDGFVYAYNDDTANIVRYADDHLEAEVLASAPFVVNDMAYDYTRDVMYAISNSDEAALLYELDLETGEFTLTGELTGVSDALTLAITTDGVFYMIDFTGGDLYTINPDTLEATFVGDPGVDASYIQSMAYDHANDRMYWGVCTTETDADGLFEIDMETAQLSERIVQVVELTGLYFGKEVEHEPATGIELTPETASIIATETIQLTATVMPEGASQRVVWSSSDESVATVRKGVVTGVSAGVATITATTADGLFSDTCEVTVEGEVVIDLSENFNDATEGWTYIDSDGDGENWELHMLEDDWDSVFEGEGMISSASYINADDEYSDGTILDADNWMISPVFKAKGNMTASWYDCAQDTDYPDYYEVYAIVIENGYVIGNDIVDKEMTLLYSGASDSTGNWGNVTVEIPEELVGKNIVLAFRHLDKDMYILNIDMIVVSHIDVGDAEMHTVTFYDMDGTTVIAEVEVEHGMAATAPAAPEHENYFFHGWDKEFDAVVEDMSVIALYYARGDSNGDNTVNTGDAVQILRDAVGLITLSDEMRLVADANGDGNVNTGDAVEVLRWTVA